MLVVPRPPGGPAPPPARGAGPIPRAVRGPPHRRRRRQLPARVDRAPAGPSRRRLPGDHANLPGIAQRGEHHAAHRVHQVAHAGGREDAMTGELTAELTEGRTNYLNADYGVRSWLLTVDHKRIALLYLMSITVMFVIGGLFPAAIRLRPTTPAAGLLL